MNHERQPGHEAEPRAGPRIYVASLSDYNAGRLHGDWIDANQAVEDLDAAVQRMLSRSTERGAEEWAIHDYEGFGSARLGEYTPLAVVAAIAAGIAEHGPAFAAWADHVDHEIEALPRFTDAYLGQWPSIEAYAEEMLDGFGANEVLATLPEWLHPLVSLDARAYGNDELLAGAIWTSPAEDGGVYVFSANE